MHVASAAIENWMRFRGKHRREFGQGAHGITCRWEHDPNRSNFGGKSGFIEAVFQFALFGKHRFRTEDAWITRGEKQGSVIVELVDGERSLVVGRRRERGKATKLLVTIADGAGNVSTLLGDEAQLAIEREIGLGFEDFSNSCYLGQKQMARFVSDRPGDRMDIVSGWFRLGPLGDAVASVSEQLGKVLDEVDALERSRAAVRDGIAQVLAPHPRLVVDGKVVDANGMGLEAEWLDEEIYLAKKNAERLERERSEQTQTAHDFADAREYRVIVEEGKALRARVEGYAGDVPDADALAALRGQLEGLQENLGKWGEQVAQKRQLVQGKFDGTCPVAGIACPATKEINAQTEANAELLAFASQQYNLFAGKRAALAAQIASGEKLARRLEEDRRERERLKERALRLKPAAMRTEGKQEVDSASLDVALRTARDALSALERERAELEAARALVGRQEALLAKAEGELVVLRARATVLAEARRCLVAAEREVAMGNLAEIEEGANRALAELGIDLTVAVTWERETKQLAKHCDACGAAYPASQKAKSCAKCGAVRGPHMERKLEIAPSEHSGGSEDLAGICVQLAAAAWLRQDRGAAWAVAILDEPGAALDATHRAALSGNLPRLLRGFGFEQSFLTSHSPSMVYACPSQVEIIAEENGSKFAEGHSVQTPARGPDGQSVRDAESSGVRGEKASREEPVEVPVRVRRRVGRNRHQSEKRQ